MKYVFLIVATWAILGACNHADRGVKELTFAVIPSDDMLQTTKYTRNFSAYLEKETGMKVKYFTATDYTAVIEAMRTNKCHIALFGPFSYVLAAQAAGAEAIATTGFPSGKCYSYQSYLLTHAGSSIKSIDDLKVLAGTLHLSFTDPASTSGHLIPRAFLTSIGLNPDTDFASLSFAQSHAAALLSVYSQKTDLAAVSSESYKRLLAKGQTDSSRFRIIWKSLPVPPEPVCVKNTLDPRLKEKIRGAILEMHLKDSAAFKQYINYTYRGDSMRHHIVFVPVNDSAYNFLRETARQVKSLNIH